MTIKEIKKQLDEIEEEQDKSRYRQNIILSALRNLLAQNNPNGVNDYLIDLVDRAK